MSPSKHIEGATSISKKSNKLTLLHTATQRTQFSSLHQRLQPMTGFHFLSRKICFPIISRNFACHSQLHSLNLLSLASFSRHLTSTAPLMFSVLIYFIIITPKEKLTVRMSVPSSSVHLSLNVILTFEQSAGVSIECREAHKYLFSSRVSPL